MTQQNNQIVHARVIIIDEAPMSSKEIFDCINRTLQRIMDNSVDFGGKIRIIIMGGNF